VHALREERRAGARYLNAATALLQRVRRAHPTKGSFEAADLQWWWRVPRATDEIDQLFWFDDLGRPEAAVILTDWGDGVALDPMLMPDATADRVAQVVDRGLAHAAASGFEAVELEVDRADAAMRTVLFDRGFTIAGDGLVETWIAADARPEISPLPGNYRLSDRRHALERPHHLIERSGPEVEARLRQTSLYRPDLDLLVLDDRDHVAAYGLFWFDPETATGLVEPMRTEDAHQRRGLARHVLTAGVGRLVTAGATRIKICFRPGNAAAKPLYLGVGFEPVAQTDVLARGPGADGR